MEKFTYSDISNFRIKVSYPQGAEKENVKNLLDTILIGKFKTQNTKSVNIFQSIEGGFPLGFIKGDGFEIRINFNSIECRISEIAPLSFDEPVTKRIPAEK